MDAAYYGTARYGYSRYDVLEPILFDEIVEALESLGASSCNVTRRRLVLSDAADSTTGHFTKEWIETTGVKAVPIPRSSNQIALRHGTYVRLDMLLYTCEGFLEGDEVKMPDGEYYEVKGSRPFSFAPNSFSHYEVDLTHLPFHEA